MLYHRVRSLNLLKLTKKVFRFVGVDVNEMAVIDFPWNGIDIFGVVMLSQRSHMCML